MNQTLGTQRTIMKDLTFISSKFQKERRNYGAQYLKKLLAGNVTNLVKCRNLQIQEAQGTPKEGKPKENHTQTHHNQTVEN